jgi:aminomethyltransferase
MSAPDLRHTPLHAEHVRLNARLVPFAGFEMPVQYSGISAEHTAVRERAGIFDVSHMGELWLRGDAAEKLTDSLVTNAIGKLEEGRAAYTCCCNAEGTILDDLIVYRLAKGRVLVVCNASNRDKISGHFREHTQGKVDFQDESDGTALLALQGPKALAILQTAGVGLGDVAKTLPSFRVRETEVAGRKAIVARTGYTGEDGVEIFCRNEDAVAIWSALLEAGRSNEILPVGLGARDTLRLEARLALYGNDIDETTNPIEAGLGWVVKLDKDFIGRDALVQIKAQGPSRTLVGFEMVGRGVARHGYDLKDQKGEKVGLCTSGGPSPTLGKSIGLGYVPVGMAAVGTHVVVDCRGRETEARVVPTPFYKRAR